MKQGAWIGSVVLWAGLMTWAGMAQAAGAKAGTSVADQEGQPGFLHGGTLSMAGGHGFETVFGPEGVRVYLYTPEKTPAMVEGAKGTVALTLPDGTSKDVRLTMEVPADGEPAVYFCPMHKDVVQMKPGICEKCGGMKLYQQNRLFGKTDLSQIKTGEVTAEFKIQGLSEKAKEASFTATYAPMAPAVAGKGKGKPGKGHLPHPPVIMAREPAPPAQPKTPAPQPETPPLAPAK